MVERGVPHSHSKTRSRHWDLRRGSRQTALHIGRTPTIDAENLTKIGDRHVLGQVETDDPQNTPSRKSQKLNAMHATRPSMAATLI